MQLRMLWCAANNCHQFTCKTHNVIIIWTTDMNKCRPTRSHTFLSNQYRSALFIRARIRRSGLSSISWSMENMNTNVRNPKGNGCTNFHHLVHLIAIGQNKPLDGQEYFDPTQINPGVAQWVNMEWIKNGKNIEIVANMQLLYKKIAFK